MINSKYFEVNEIMGRSAAYNDKISTGRSLKWYYRGSDDIFKWAASQLLQISYVKNVKRGSNWIRVYL